MSMVGWHLLDIFFMLLGCYFVISGVFRGFVGETLSLGGLILSVYLGFRYSEMLGGLIGRTAGLNRTVAQIVAAVAVWLVVSILFSLLRRGLKKIMDLANLSTFDRVLGILCGLTKTVVVIYAVLIGGLLLTPVVEPSWMSHSETLLFAGRYWPAARRLIIGSGALPRAGELPDGTLEQLLRRYRRRENSFGEEYAWEALAPLLFEGAMLDKVPAEKQ